MVKVDGLPVNEHVARRTLAANHLADPFVHIANLAARSAVHSDGVGQLRRKQSESDQFPLGLVGGPGLEAEDGANTEGVGELLKGLSVGGVLAALDPRHR